MLTLKQMQPNALFTVVFKRRDDGVPLAARVEEKRQAAPIIVNIQQGD